MAAVVSRIRRASDQNAMLIETTPEFRIYELISALVKVRRRFSDGHLERKFVIRSKLTPIG